MDEQDLLLPPLEDDEDDLPPLDLGDDSAIQAALQGAGELAPPALPADAALLEPPEIDVTPKSLGLAPAPAPPSAADDPYAELSPADLGLVAEPDELPEAAPVLPPELAPDFRRVDYARALDRLAAPRIDPTTAAQAAADAERTLRDLETRQVQLQRSTVDSAQQRARIDAAITQAQQLPEGKDKALQLEALQLQRLAVEEQLDADTAAYQAIVPEVLVAQQGRASARAQYQEDLAAAQREGEILSVAAQTAATQAAAAEEEQILRDAKAREAELKADQSAAQKQLDDDRKAYRDMLERGPENSSKSIFLAIGAVLGEALAARNYSREPDFGRALQVVEQATNDQFQRRLKARLETIESSADAVTRAAREREIYKAETATRRAEALASIERELTTRIAGAQGTIQEAQLLATRDDVRAAREAKEAEVLAANAKLARDKRRDQLETDKLAAQVRLEQAKAAAEERKGRGGSGLGKGRSLLTVDPAIASLPPEERKNVEERGIRDPVTGAWLRTEGGQFVMAADPKKATELRDQIGAMRDYTALSGRLAELVHEHGMEPKLWRGEVRQEMDALVADILLITKNAEQTGALDKGSVEVITDKIAGGIKPGDFGASASVILQGAERLQDRFQRRLRDLSVTGKPVDMAFPDVGVQRGEIERQARAGEEARRLASDVDSTGTPTTGDPLGEADSADKYAGVIRRATAASEKAVAAVRSAKPGAPGMPVTVRIGPDVPGVPGAGTIAVDGGALATMQAQLTAMETASPGTPEHQQALRSFEREARSAGLLGDRQDFVSDKTFATQQAQQQERKADAVRVANWLIQNNADPRRVDLGYLRKIGVVKAQHEDKKALGQEIADAYRRYAAAPAEPAPAE